MARRMILLLASLLLVLMAVGPTAAADGCPAAASGFRAGAVDWEWAPGDPVPAPGGDLLWDVTVVQGAAIEDLTTQQLAELFGLTTVSQLYETVLEGWRGLDRNMDGAVCFKSMPLHDNGLPAYFSNFVDTNAKTAK